jgi:uncharacterized protein
MMNEGALMNDMTLAPVTGKARIDVLDIMRGFAILAIYFMNVPFQAVPVLPTFIDFRLIGWTPADQLAWATTSILLEGTQRCLLEFLFGAGMMVLAAKAMEPDGPVAVADLYMRRTMWLLAFGLLDIFVVLWVGDILSIYAVAALFLFPFRRLGPKLLVTLGLAFALFTAVTGGLQYADRLGLIDRVHVAEAHRAAGATLTPTDSKALADWNKLRASRTPNAEQRKAIAEERTAHAGGFVPYAAFYYGVWSKFIIAKGIGLITVFEAFCAMLIGVALWKWGIIQGRRDARFYAVLMVAAYGVGLTLRAVGVSEVFTFAPGAKTIWFTNEFARLATGLGHLALFNLAVKSRVGAAILSPLKAAGRFAFSLYFVEQLIGIHLLFSPYGLNLWGRFGWAVMFWVSALMFFGLLIVANLWGRWFAMGPMEWAWRSLAYCQRQPFLKRRAGTVAATADADPMPQAVPA